MKRTAGMEGDTGHRVHVRLGDVLDDYWDIVVPCTDRLIVRSSHESPVLVYECDGVDRSKMLVVFLDDFGSVHIILWLWSDSIQLLGAEGIHTWMIFLSDIPARKMCCLSSSGWNLIT